MDAVISVQSMLRNFVSGFMGAYRVCRYEYFTLGLGIDQDSAFDLADRTATAFYLTCVRGELETDIFDSEMLMELVLSTFSDKAMIQEGDEHCVDD